jgi:signal recognition particle receptor subunit beta
MKTSWENFSEIKEQVRRYVSTARQHNFITEEECASILDKVNGDTLTIGIIGQMKSGKSTFLNALLFKDALLPAASKPMTAALSLITYREQKELSAEFYSAEEWEGITRTAALQEDSPKAKAARELLEKSRGLGNQLASLLGQRQSAGLEDLREYVGFDGKYMAITKAVTIYYPDPQLRGVRIVDTPGTNDPVVSREQRTLDFLSTADVVILLLYAERPFDEEDREILFEKIKNVGVGKIIIAVNKYDIKFKDGELLENIQAYVKKQITKNVFELNDPVLNRLLKDVNPVLFSSMMALFAVMPEEKFDEDARWHYDDLYNAFEWKSNDELYELSRIRELEDEINRVIEKEKLEILVRKPINEIHAKIDAKRTEFEKELFALREENKNLSLSNDELEEKKKSYAEAEQRVRQVIENGEAEIKDYVNSETTRVEHKLRQELNDCSARLHIIVDSAKRDQVESKMSTEIQELKFIFEDECKYLLDTLKIKFRKMSEQVVYDIQDILSYTGDEELVLDYIDACKRELQKFDTLTIEGVFDTSGITNAKKRGIALGLVVGIIGGIIGLGIRELFYRSELTKWKTETHAKIDEMLQADKLTGSLQVVYDQVNEFTAFFKTKFLAELLVPIAGQLDQIERLDVDKQKKKQENEQRLLELSQNKDKVVLQLAEINNYINGL